MSVKRKKKIKQEDKNIAFIIRKLIFSTVFSVILFFILCAVTSFIFLKADTKPDLFPWAMIIIFGLCGFVCGLTAVLPIKKNGLVLGMISSVPMFFIIFVALCIVNKSGIGTTGWISFAATVVCAGLGGISGNKK